MSFKVSLLNMYGSFIITLVGLVKEITLPSPHLYFLNDPEVYYFVIKIMNKTG